jgi:uncharacterized membrane protein
VVIFWELLGLPLPLAMLQEISTTVSKDRLNLQVSPLSFALCSAIAFVGAFMMHELGIKRQWSMAMFVTVGLFWYAANLFRSWWRHFSFWLSMLMALTIHSTLNWVLIEVLLPQGKDWSQVVLLCAFLEALPLYLFIAAGERGIARMLSLKQPRCPR